METSKLREEGTSSDRRSDHAGNVTNIKFYPFGLDEFQVKALFNAEMMTSKNRDGRPHRRA